MDCSVTFFCDGKRKMSCSAAVEFMKKLDRKEGNAQRGIYSIEVVKSYNIFCQTIERYTVKYPRELRCVLRCAIVSKTSGDEKKCNAMCEMTARMFNEMRR